MLKPQIILMILLYTVHVGFAVVAQALGLSGSQSKPYMVHSPNPVWFTVQILSGLQSKHTQYKCKKMQITACTAASLNMIGLGWLTCA